MKFVPIYSITTSGAWGLLPYFRSRKYNCLVLIPRDYFSQDLPAFASNPEMEARLYVVCYSLEVLSRQLFPMRLLHKGNHSQGLVNVKQEFLSASYL